MFIVCRKALSVRYEIAEFDTEEEAIEFCESWNWEIMDENCFVWDLIIVER